MAAAAASLGFALGGAVFPQAIETLIRSVGWRHAYVTLGALVFATMLPVGLLLFRDRPERFGLAPDLGAPPSPRSKSEVSFTRREAMHTAVFWTLAAANALSNALGTGLLLNHYDLLARAGFPREVAVVAFAPLAMVQVLSALVAGPLVDRISPHRLMVLPMTAMAASCLLVATIGSTRALVVYAVVLGLALGSFQAINIAVYAHHFGRGHLGEIRGVTFVITIVGAALGPLPFGWSAAHGGYFPVLASGAILCTLVAIAHLIVKPPTPVVVAT